MKKYITFFISDPKNRSYQFNYLCCLGINLIIQILCISDGTSKTFLRWVHFIFLKRPIKRVISQENRAIFVKQTNQQFTLIFINNSYHLSHSLYSKQNIRYRWCFQFLILFNMFVCIFNLCVMYNLSLYLYALSSNEKIIYQGLQQMCDLIWSHVELLINYLN